MPDFTPPPFQKSWATVVINTLWLLSLVTALIAASLGILVKQWLHELLSYETHDPMERLKLRFFRETGVERWKVFTIASSLPLLLQLALLLFFVGLVFFLHQLDAIVTWCTTVIISFWLAALLLVTFAPVFSSQCPYKTPFLKGIICRLRTTLLPWPRTLTHFLLRVTSRKWFPAFKRWINRIDDKFVARLETLEALEEESVCKDGSLSLPVISFARDLLQGERLSDSFTECISGISDDDMKKTLDRMTTQGSSLHRMLPSTPYGLAGIVGSFALEGAQEDHLRFACFNREMHPFSSATLYVGLCHLHREAYKPDGLYLPIPYQSLPAFIRLIQANPTSATLSLFTMFSIRQYTIMDHPYSFPDLFECLDNSEKGSHNIGKPVIFPHSPLSVDLNH